MAEPYYITTAIAYPNGRPHIGHAYEAIAADVIARFQRQQGRDVRFQTGTDEHGLKMAQKARDLGVTPKALSDEMTKHFIEMCALLNVSYDVFQRTTEPGHHAASQELWRRMDANGDLYLDRYEGWYSVRDEAYYEAAELSEGEGGQKLSPQGTPVEWTVEESWFFRLSRYQDKLLALFAEQPDFLQPDSRRNEVVRFVEGGLRDLSVSRTSFDWGVKVPPSADHADQSHVMYVWVDALTNYLTGLGFPEATEAMATWWPADLHLIGKDIVRFHAVYWPAFLMSAGLPLPKCVFGHGFLLHRGEKMSKSLGNVVDPLKLVARFGVDALRYFLMRDVSFGQDGSYSAEAIVTRCNAELANSFGNLAQRVLSQIYKNLDGQLPDPGELNIDDLGILDSVRHAMLASVAPEMAALNFSVAIELWMSQVFACNQFVDSQAPWTLKKQGKVARMETVLAVLFQCIRDLAIAIRPVIPASADRLLDQMGIPAQERDAAALTDSGWYARTQSSAFRLAQPVGVFPRLELPVLAEH